MDTFPLTARGWRRAWCVLGVIGSLLAGPAMATSLATPLAEAVAKDKVCTTCHDAQEAKPILALYQTRHGVRADGRTPTCQSCHGDSLAHAQTKPSSTRFPRTDVDFSRKGSEVGAASRPCLTCHQGNTARHWPGSAHERQDVGCPSCHTLHAAEDPMLTKAGQAAACGQCHGSVRSQFLMPSRHPLAKSRMACTDCHNPHGSTGPKLLHQDSVNDTCFTCHAEKRGPFLWEHVPASEDCGNCHAPHGTANRPLLKMRSPWLCQQCHANERHPATAYSATSGSNTSLAASLKNTAQLPLHGCSNCHSQVHGSNHPGGAKLLR